jgi:hypothetical protein
MSRDDWDDDENYRSRRRRYRDRFDDDDDDDYDLSRRGYAKSGSVTGVGVISIILGSLDLLAGLCGSLFLFAVGAHGPPPGFPGSGVAMAVALIIVLLVFLWGALAIAGGVGVLSRKQSGRVLILLVSGVSAAVGILCLVLSFAALSDRGNMAAGEEEAAMGFLVFVVLAIVLITYCIWSYVVLLNGQNASEFRS